VLQNPNVASAIIGASRPEQVTSNVAAAGVVLEPAVLAQIDAVIGEIADRDPGKTVSPDSRPS
jgi:aryl-alcohol dehydrogenase-like predicted oxidoreductase